MQDFIHTPAGYAPVEIYEDGGGLVTEYQRKAIQYSLENRQVQIKGACRSACLLALSVPDVCVTPSAVVKAHHAYEEKTHKVRYDVTQQMLNSLPPKIKHALENSIEVNYTPDATLTYQELRELGVPSCSQAKPRTHIVRKPEPQKENALLQILKLFPGKLPYANR